MNYHHIGKNDSTLIHRILCAIVFVVFCFLWLYFFQADLLTVVQHALSHGQTSYQRLLGTVLVTAILQLLQWGVCAVTRLRKRWHALTYLPSLVLLALMTAVSEDFHSRLSFSIWAWLAPLLLVLWLMAVFVARFMEANESVERTGLFSRQTWTNMLTLALMILLVTLTTNTHAVFHYRTHVETALANGDYDEALRVGNRSHETDVSLTMLRVYALSRQGLLGEQLFRYPVTGSTSDDLLPLNGRGHALLIPADTIYRHLGAKPAGPMSTRRYLDLLLQSGKATPAVGDYLLCGLLLDRDLDDFARNIGRFYELNESLPRHYREALVLYAHLRSHPVVVYHDAVTDTDWADLQELERNYPDATERKGKVMEKYAGSYWYYYEYMK